MNDLIRSGSGFIVSGLFFNLGLIKPTFKFYFSANRIFSFICSECQDTLSLRVQDKYMQVITYLGRLLYHPVCYVIMQLWLLQKVALSSQWLMYGSTLREVLAWANIPMFVKRTLTSKRISPNDICLVSMSIIHSVMNQPESSRMQEAKLASFSTVLYPITVSTLLLGARPETKNRVKLIQQKKR